MPTRFKRTLPLNRAALWSVIVGIYSCLPVLKAKYYGLQSGEVSSDLVATLSIVLTLFIGFRVTTAYERWWEARKLWGTLVNVSRNLAVKMSELRDPTPEDLRRSRDLLVAFAFGLRDYLRDCADLRQLPGFQNSTDTPQHLPSYIAKHVYRLIDSWRANGTLSDGQLMVFDSDARQLLDVAGACERIKNTYVSISWRVITWQIIAVSLLALPWGLAANFGWWAVPMVMVFGYFALAGEAIAELVEEPFGRAEDQLDLAGICIAIDRSVSEVLHLDDHERSR